MARGEGRGGGEKGRGREKRKEARRWIKKESRYSAGGSLFLCLLRL